MKKMNRWLYAVVGICVLLFAGIVYAWSVLVAPIAAYFTEWTNAELSFTFTICMICFCLGGFAAGKLLKKGNIKRNMFLSAVLFLVGFSFASGMQSLVELYIGYGVLAGFASGIAYNTTIGTISKYFPDKPGLISGILLMGFGMGSFLIGKAYQAFTGSGEAFRSSFRRLGIILFVVMFFSGFLLHNPSDEEVAIYYADNKKRNNYCIEEEKREYTAYQMIKTSSFWLYFTWATLLSAVGLALISQAGAVTAFVNPLATAGMISTAAGLISIFNGCGRVIFGRLFDRIGRRKTMVSIEMLFVLSCILMSFSIYMKNEVLLIIGFMITGLAYGGVTPTNSAFISSFYGKENYAVNFSIINMNLLIASFGSTAAGKLYDISNSYMSTFLFLLAAVVVGSICAVGIKKQRN